MNNNLIKIAAVGDICPGDKAIMGAGVGNSTIRNGADFIFSKVEGVLKNADIAIGNLEGVLSKNATDSTKKTFCGTADFAIALKKNNFNIVSVANNHILEHGVNFFRDTVEILNSSGINVCGLRDTTGNYYSKPVIIELKGKKVGFVAYNWVGKDKFKNTDDYIAQSHDSVVNYTWDRTKKTSDLINSNCNVIRDITKLKSEVDYVILLPHWGYEFVNLPPYGVTCESKKFIDAGTDLIIGSHPHVLQGHELYNGKRIFYSLGNFVFDMRMAQTKLSAILEYNIELDGNDSFSLTCCKANKKFQPVPLQVPENRAILSVIERSTDVIQSTEASSKLEDNLIYLQFEKKYVQIKWLTIFLHFVEMFKHPAVCVLIAKKVWFFLTLIKDRLAGKNVRW